MSRWRRSATDQRTAYSADGDARRDSVRGIRIRRLGDILLIAGGLVLAYPLWSAAYAQMQQTRLDAAYTATAAASVQGSPAAYPEASTPVPDNEMVRRLAVIHSGRLKRGDAIGRLKIPAIALDHLVQEGQSGPASLDPDSDRALLRNGPVHYATTPLPGAGEPFAVAGHRTTYGAPFAKLDKLRAGDAILVETPYADFHYIVVKKTVVEPGDVSVLLDRGYGLVLTTCTPPYSASHRLVVWASLESSIPRGQLQSGGH